MNDDMNYFLAKLAVIEVRLRDLYVDKFAQRAQPIQTAASSGEAYGRGSQALENPSLPPEIALLHSELTNQFFDDVVAELRRRVEIRGNQKKQDPE